MAELTDLQRRILTLTSDVDPRWTLTGGAALTGFYLHHRTTRDLDLFWRGRAKLGSVTTLVRDRLTEAGLSVDNVQSSSAFVRFRVSDAHESVIVDLVAEPVASLEPVVQHYLGSVALQVDSPFEILVNKLCALVSRSEVRDLIDLQGLLATGLSLEQALKSAPVKDGGFSPLVLSWTLSQLRLEVQTADVAGLTRFRDELVSRVLAIARPEESDLGD